MSRPQPPPDAQRPSRGEISLSDAITATATLGATEAVAVTSILEALGLAVDAPRAPVTPVLPPVPSQFAQLPPTDDSDDDRAPDDAPSPAPDLGATVDYVDDTAPRPTWLAEVTAIEFGPMRSRVAIEPPLPEAQARAAMVVAAGMRLRGRELDLRALVARATRLQPLAPAPLLLELRTASSIQLLIDVGDAMEPYAADVAFLEQRFVDVAGSDRVTVHTFTGTPLRGVDPDFLTRDVSAWKRPPPRSLAVVLSELGAGGPRLDRERARADEWRRLAIAVAECDASLRVLTPFPAARWPLGLADLAQVTNWESIADLVEHRA